MWHVPEVRRKKSWRRARGTIIVLLVAACSSSRILKTALATHAMLRGTIALSGAAHLEETTLSRKY